MTSRIPDWQVAAKAADWVTRMDAGPLGPDEQVGLAEWLRMSPTHVDELLFSASIMAGLTQVDPGKSRSIEDLLSDTAPEVIPLFHGHEVSGELSGQGTPGANDDSDEDVATQRGARVLRYWPALAASLLAVVAVSWYGSSSAPPSEASSVVQGARLLASAGAEPRSIVLEDGSVLYLKANSSARVAFSDTRRLIELVEGAALFDVAHDPDRPFRVFAAGTIAEAVGTRFTVERADGFVTVAVLEGQVLVGTRMGADLTRAGLRDDTIADSQMGREPVRLGAGSSVQLLENGQRTASVAAAAAPPAEPWQSRQLSFNDEGLSVIAAEFNRFNAVKIVVADAELARTRFSGVFDAHDPESFIAFLELSAGVRVERPRDDQVVLTASE
jgi:transmembrane sensor